MNTDMKTITIREVNYVCEFVLQEIIFRTVKVILLRRQN